MNVNMSFSLYISLYLGTMNMWKSLEKDNVRITSLNNVVLQLNVTLLFPILNRVR
jgi:hypothetical protein